MAAERLDAAQSVGVRTDARAPRGARSRVLGWLPVGLAILGVLIAAFFVLRPTPTAPGLVGKAAPDFTLRTTSGLSVHLASLRGHPVLLNFWGVSCPPCRREAPLLQQAAGRYGRGGLLILGIDDQNDDAASIDAFAGERGVAYPMLLDPGGSVGLRYGVHDLPYSVLVDRHGVVRGTSPAPFVDPATLTNALRAIL